MHIEDRMISRSRNLSTPFARLQELAPRLLSVLPNSPDGCADRLLATRQEILDLAAALEDQVAIRGGCLVRRGGGLTAFDARDGFYTTRRSP